MSCDHNETSTFNMLSTGVMSLVQTQTHIHPKIFRIVSYGGGQQQQVLAGHKIATCRANTQVRKAVQFGDIRGRGVGRGLGGGPNKMQVQEVVKLGHTRPTIGSGVRRITTCLLIIDKRCRVYIYPYTYIYAHGNIRCSSMRVCRNKYKCTHTCMQ